MFRERQSWHHKLVNYAVARSCVMLSPKLTGLTAYLRQIWAFLNAMRYCNVVRYDQKQNAKHNCHSTSGYCSATLKCHFGSWQWYVKICDIMLMLTFRTSRKWKNWQFVPNHISCIAAPYWIKSHSVKSFIFPETSCKVCISNFKSPPSVSSTSTVAGI